MTAVLVAVTFGALGLAGALLFYVLRFTREERDRSAARAAALTEMIGEGSGSLGQPDEWNAAATPEPMVQAPMFGSATTDGQRTAPRLLLAPAMGVLVVGLALTGIYAWNRSGTAAEAAPALAPLELVSLRHERQGSTLIVSGLVRNPHAGRTITGLSAVAFTYDRQGTFLTSGRVQLDFPRLGAGDESPFAISVPQSAGVSRYRVSFRTEDGVVPHLDRREPVTLSSAKAQVTR